MFYFFNLYGYIFSSFFFFFFKDTATTEIYTLSLHDALPICAGVGPVPARVRQRAAVPRGAGPGRPAGADRKSTRLNSSHANISYAVFCLKKKNILTKMVFWLTETSQTYC